MEPIISPVDSFAVLSFRASLFVAAAGLCTGVLGSFLIEEVFLDNLTTSRVVESVIADATIVALLGTSAALVLANWAPLRLPLLGWPVGAATFRVAGILPLAAAASDPHSLHDASLALEVATALLVWREVSFFGLEYKLDAAAAAALGFLAVATQNDAAFAGWGTSFGLMAFSKLFEPIRSDIVPTGSVFLAEDPLE